MTMTDGTHVGTLAGVSLVLGLGFVFAPLYLAMFLVSAGAGAGAVLCAGEPQPISTRSARFLR